jgi:hypothetical protein
MFIQFPTHRAIILESADLYPAEITDAGVGFILDELGNQIHDTSNRPIFDEAN